MEILGAQFVDVDEGFGSASAPTADRSDESESEEQGA
jgi:hypothetical protein